MNSHIPRRQRLLMLLAGFFGFVITATVSVFPGIGIAELIRAGTAAAANTAGTRVPAAKAVTADRDRRSTPLALAATWRYSGGGRLDASASSARDTRPVAPAEVHGHGFHAAVPSDVAGTAVRPSGIAFEHVVLPAAPRSTVQVRGPPSITGS